MVSLVKMPSLDEMIDEKELRAKEVIRDSMGKNGIWANPQFSRYKYQCWTRDFAIGGLSGLLAIDQMDFARKHIDNIRDRQAPDGKVPDYFKDDELMWGVQKAYTAVFRGRALHQAKKLFKKLSGTNNNVHTAHTADTELHYLNAVFNMWLALGRSNKRFDNANHAREFAYSHDSSMDKAFGYAESKVKDGFIRGADWRDAVDFGPEPALLSNQVLLAAAYSQIELYKLDPGAKINGRFFAHVGNGIFENKGKVLAQKIHEAFQSDGYLSDTPSSTNFDCYGQALAILIMNAGYCNESNLTDKFASMRTQHGFKANDLPIETPWALDADKAVQQRATDWPHVTGKVIEALCRLDTRRSLSLAKDIRNKWTQQEGFREFYDPSTGEGKNGIDQMWSASAYLAAIKAIRNAENRFS